MFWVQELGRCICILHFQKVTDNANGTLADKLARHCDIMTMSNTRLFHASYMIYDILSLFNIIIYRGLKYPKSLCEYHDFCKSYGDKKTDDFHVFDLLSHSSHTIQNLFPDHFLISFLINSLKTSRPPKTIQYRKFYKIDSDSFKTP